MAGKVILVGAGPGGVELLTVKGRRELRRAEVVVYDRLVDEEVLRLIPEEAERIDVGKRVADHPVPQHRINEILVEQARRGKRVVRLKGGDCFVFGRGGEELERLAEEKIPFEVVPGITSALAAAAYAGIPVTHRDFCASVHIIAGHRRKGEALEMDYRALTGLGGTLVFLMSVATFPEIAKGLIAAGMPAETPCAIVESGARPEQRKWLTTVSEAETCIAKGVRSPAIFIVGRVCGLSDRMDWFDRLPLKGMRLLVMRPRPDARRLGDLLRENGARVTEISAGTPELLDIALPEQGTLAFADAEAVDALMDSLKRRRMDARALAGKRLVCLSESAAAALERCALTPDGRVDSPEKIIGEAAVLCSQEELRACNSDLPELAVCPVWRRRWPAEGTVEPSDFDAVLFTTLSGVHAFGRLAGSAAADVRAVCIGEQTRLAAEELGMRAVQSRAMTLESMVEGLKEL